MRLIRLAPLALVAALGGCGAPGAPEPRIDLSPPEGTVAVVGPL
jgi:hypothetical protein